MFANVFDFKLRDSRVARAASAGQSAIELRFSRIAQALAARWNGNGIDAYLNSLLLDDRGNRQGFPAAVLEELMFLSSLRWQLQHPNFSRADEGLAEQFSCCAAPILNSLNSRLCVANRAWVLA